MNTIHTSSFTHEIFSYGSREDLERFIANRYRELVPGGVWISRDVVGPEDKDAVVLMELCAEDGRGQDYDKEVPDRNEFAQYLTGLSTQARFLRFARDFRRKEGYRLEYQLLQVSGREMVRLRLGDAGEFLSKKDYVDNWQSEMHEAFCFWSYSDWVRALQKEGFVLQPGSRAYVNSWIVDNRYKGKVRLWREEGGGLQELPYPVTNTLLIAQKVG